MGWGCSEGDAVLERHLFITCSLVLHHPTAWHIITSINVITMVADVKYCRILGFRGEVMEQCVGIWKGGLGVLPYYHPLWPPIMSH